MTERFFLEFRHCGGPELEILLTTRMEHLPGSGVNGLRYRI